MMQIFDVHIYIYIHTHTQKQCFCDKEESKSSVQGQAVIHPTSVSADGHAKVYGC